MLSARQQLSTTSGKRKINTLLQVPQHWASAGWKSRMAWPTRACSYHSAFVFQGFFFIKIKHTSYTVDHTHLVACMLTTFCTVVTQAVASS